MLKTFEYIAQLLLLPHLASDRRTICKFPIPQRRDTDESFVSTGDFLKHQGIGASGPIGKADHTVVECKCSTCAAFGGTIGTMVVGGGYYARHGEGAVS